MMTDQVETMNNEVPFVRESLAALLGQERHYGCEGGYLCIPTDHGSATAALQEEQRGMLMKSSAGTPYASATDLVSMVEELANVATDRRAVRATTGSAAAGVVVDASDFIPATDKDDSGDISKSNSMASFRDVRDVDQHLQQQQLQSQLGDSTSTASRKRSRSCYDGAFNLEAQTKRVESFRFWRQQMFDWACMVVDSFQIDRDVVAVSFNLLDRYVSREDAKINAAESATEISRDDFQLFAMTCLYLAVKLLQPYPKKLGVGALVDMSRGYYTEEDVAYTERDILSTLSWHVSPTTANGFSDLYWSLFPAPSLSPSASSETAAIAIKDRMRATCATLTEIAVADAFFVPYKDSHVGLAAVMIAARLHGVGDDQLRSGLLTNLDGVVSVSDDPDFAAVYRQLELLYCQ